jgi:hypothetical protein
MSPNWTMAIVHDVSKPYSSKFSTHLEGMHKAKATCRLNDLQCRSLSNVLRLKFLMQV